MPRLVLMIAFVLSLGCDGPIGPIGPQGERGTAGVVGSFDVITINVVQSLYQGQWLFVSDDRLGVDTIIQILVARPGSVITYMEFSVFAEASASLFDTEPQSFIGTGTIVFFDPSQVLLGETILISVLP